MGKDQASFTKKMFQYRTELSITGHFLYASQYYRTATPLLYNYDYNTSFPSNWKDLYFQRIENAISGSENQNVLIAPLIEAARVAFLLGRHELSIRYLNELQKLLPRLCLDTLFAWEDLF